MNQIKILLLIFATCLLLGLCACQTGDRAEIRTRDLTWGVGAPLPLAKDFLESAPDGYSARFAQTPQFSRVGEYDLTIIVSDPRGKESEYQVKFTLIHDQEPPKMSGVEDISVYVGDGISYRSGVALTDNCDGALTLTVDSSSVNAQQEGVYPVTYTAIDAAGNTSKKQIMVYVYREKVSEEMLYTLLDPIIAQHISVGANREQLVRDVYSYVYYSIDYDAYSDKSDWVRSAYEGLRSGEGDCFTYFAISKAFFRRLGIESMDIQRTPGLVDERHYWNLVNIGTAASPRWYHFDATQLSGSQHSGCLLTDLQVQAYTRQREDQNGMKKLLPRPQAWSPIIDRKDVNFLCKPIFLNIWRKLLRGLGTRLPIRMEPMT